MHCKTGAPAPRQHIRQDPSQYPARAGETPALPAASASPKKLGASGS